MFLTWAPIASLLYIITKRFETKKETRFSIKSFSVFEVLMLLYTIGAFMIFAKLMFDGEKDSQKMQEMDLGYQQLKSAETCLSKVTKDDYEECMEETLVTAYIDQVEHRDVFRSRGIPYQTEAVSLFGCKNITSVPSHLKNTYPTTFPNEIICQIEIFKYLNLYNQWSEESKYSQNELLHFMCCNGVNEQNTQQQCLSKISNDEHHGHSCASLEVKIQH